MISISVNDSSIEEAKYNDMFLDVLLDSVVSYVAFCQVNYTNATTHCTKSLWQQRKTTAETLMGQIRSMVGISHNDTLNLIEEARALWLTGLSGKIL